MSEQKKTSLFNPKALALIGFVAAGSLLIGLPALLDNGSGYDKERFRDIANDLSNDPVVVEEIIEAMGDLSDDIGVGKTIGLALKMRRGDYTFEVGPTEHSLEFMFDDSRIIIVANDDDIIEKAIQSPVFIKD